MSMQSQTSQTPSATRRKLIKANIKLNLSLDDDDESISVVVPENKTEDSCSPPTSLPLHMEASRRKSPRPVSSFYSSDVPRLRRTQTEQQEQENQDPSTNDNDGHINRLKRCK